MESKCSLQSDNFVLGTFWTFLNVSIVVYWSVRCSVVSRELCTISLLNYMFSKSFKFKLKTSSMLHQSNEHSFIIRLHGTYHIIVITLVSSHIWMFHLWRLNYYAWIVFIPGKTHQVVNVVVWNTDDFIRFIIKSSGMQQFANRTLNKPIYFHNKCLFPPLLGTLAKFIDSISRLQK